MQTTQRMQAVSDVNSGSHAPEHPDREKSAATTFTRSHDRFDSMNSILTCKICLRWLYEPFTISCGHTFCYTCLRKWFMTSLSCPECRSIVMRAPAPSFLIKEMTSVFLDSIDSLSQCEREEHEKCRREDTKRVREDRERGELFGRKFALSNLFATHRHSFTRRRPGLLSPEFCPYCFAVLTATWCRNCGRLPNRADVTNGTERRNLNSGAGNGSDGTNIVAGFSHERSLDSSLLSHDIFDSTDPAFEHWNYEINGESDLENPQHQQRLSYDANPLLSTAYQLNTGDQVVSQTSAPFESRRNTFVNISPSNRNQTLGSSRSSLGLGPGLSWSRQARSYEPSIETSFIDIIETSEVGLFRGIHIDDGLWHT